MMRTCTGCGRGEPEVEFNSSLKTNYDGSKTRRPFSECKGCRSARSKAWRERTDYKTPKRTVEQAHGQRAYKLRTKYGLTIEDLARMVEEQDGVCACCHEMPVYSTFWDKTKAGQTVVDHDHETGKVRGLLCGGCNLMLGYAKDNPLILQRGALYLKERS